jgi:hypothetical protein
LQTRRNHVINPMNTLRWQLHIPYSICHCGLSFIAHEMFVYTAGPIYIGRESNTHFPGFCIIKMMYRETSITVDECLTECQKEYINNYIRTYIGYCQHKLQNTPLLKMFFFRLSYLRIRWYCHVWDSKIKNPCRSISNCPLKTWSWVFLPDLTYWMFLQSI